MSATPIVQRCASLQRMRLSRTRSPVVLLSLDGARATNVARTSPCSFSGRSTFAGRFNVSSRNTAAHPRRELVVRQAGLLGFNLEGPGSVLEAILVLAAIVAVHECGHFLAARLQKIHVTKFSIGFGPSLATYQGKNVEYSLRAFPLGGYVGFPDDDPQSPYSPDDPDLLRNRPILDRFWVISAGVIANVIFAFMILWAQVGSVGVLETHYKQGIIIPDVVQSSAAQRAGLQSGDIVLSVDGKQLPASSQAVPSLVAEIKAHPGEQLMLRVQRSGEQRNIPVVPDVTAEGTGRIGVQLQANAESTHRFAENPAESLVLASREFGRLANSVFTGFREMVTNFEQTAEQISGPVAIVAVGSEIARADATGLFQFAAIVNINLAVVNVLPLPALDGGYLLLLAIEALRGGKKLPQTIEQGVMASGLVLLMALGTLLVVKDTLNLGVASGLLQ